MLHRTSNTACLLLAGLVLAASAPAHGQETSKEQTYQPARFVDKVTFSYMAYDAQNDTHRQKAKWQLRDVASWQNFASTLKDLPEKDSGEASRKPEGGQAAPPENDYIRVRVITTNGFVARKIDIDQGGIRITNRTQKVIFYRPEKDYLQTLRKEQQNHKAFPDKLKHTRISDQEDGIIVRYKRFAHLPNPVWRINEPKAQNRLFDMLDSLRSIPKHNINYARSDDQQAKTAGITFKNVATPGNFDKVDLTPKFVRGEKIKREIHHLKDEANYFAFFKKRARKYME